jgi:hypothetical protein
MSPFEVLVLIAMYCPPNFIGSSRCRAELTRCTDPHLSILGRYRTEVRKCFIGK